MGVALTHVNARPTLSEQFAISSDSQAAILEMANSYQASISTSVMQCRSLLRELYEKHKIVGLQWIPSHCGIPENEKADELAKRGCDIIQFSNGQIGYKYASSKINVIFKTKYLSQLKERTTGILWESDIHNLQDYARSNALASFVLDTMHDCLYAHLHRF
ncbi:uncharacterized protein LOC118199445 [Stegodyphus dumicola]|uniref:uncharacterized protein LOC118199445 n=1 Tax=Stegodyphus dumicola TaxID=202533 RepID=UPI0015AF1CF3|nr:uncharacterized protein LOC118199445 [Stegodyphus dumicola]